MRMSRQELLVERFHREVVMQEQAHLRRTMLANFEAEIVRLKQELRDQELLHKKEKINLRWQQDEQVRCLAGEEGGCLWRVVWATEGATMTREAEARRTTLLFS